MQILEIYILSKEVSHQDFILKTRWDKKWKSGQLAQEKHNWKNRREDGDHSRFLLSPFFTAGSSVPRKWGKALSPQTLQSTFSGSWLSNMVGTILATTSAMPLVSAVLQVGTPQ